MLLAVDVGNTNMVFGIYEGAELKGSFRTMTDSDRTSDELGLLVCQYFQRFGLELDQIEDVVIGSVVPQVMHTLTNAMKKYVGKTPLVLDDGLDPGCPMCPAPARSGWGQTGRRRTSPLWPNTGRPLLCWTSVPPQPWTR